MATVTDFIFWGPKITADGDCSHEIKRPWKKSLPRQHIKKQRHYFADKCPSIQSYGFSSSHVWMWELDHKESWALKTWCFWTVVFENTLESLFTARRSNQSILMEISPEYSLKGLMLRLKRQCFGHLMWRTDSFEKTLMLGKLEGRRTERQMMRWLDGITNLMHMSLSKLGSWWWQGGVACCISGVTKSQTPLSDWTKLNLLINRSNAVHFSNKKCFCLYKAYTRTCGLTGS